MTEVPCLDMQYTTPQTPGGACWVGRKSWWTTSAQCYSKVPNPKGVRKLEGTQSFIVILSLLQREGWARAARVGEKSRWICTSKCLKCLWIFRHPSCLAHKCGKPIIREVYSFRTTPPQTRLYKEVAYRLVGHFKDLSTYLSQIFLRQEPQQWKKGRHQYHWCYSSKRTFLHDWMKRSLAHIIRSAKKISPEPPVASSCVPDPSMVSAFRDLGKGDTAGFCRFGLG